MEIFEVRRTFVFTETFAMRKPEVIVPFQAFSMRPARYAPLIVAVATVTLSACASGGAAAHTQSPVITASQPSVGGPPGTFSRTSSDARITRLIDVRDGMSKTALFRSASDYLSQKYTVDVSDSKAGFLMTPWQASFARNGVPDLHYRTRIIVRFLGDDWKQVSVRAEANWQHDDEWDIGVDNQLLEEVVTDLRNRIGKKAS